MKDCFYDGNSWKAILSGLICKLTVVAIIVAIFTYSAGYLIEVIKSQKGLYIVTQGTYNLFMGWLTEQSNKE